MGWQKESDDSDQSGDEETSAFNTSAHVLIAVDCNEEMFEEKIEDKSFFKAVLSVCYQILDRHLIKGYRRGGNRFAIIAVSEEKEKMTICDFQDDLPKVLKLLNKLCGKSDGELKQLYCRKSPVNFGEFLLNSRGKFQGFSKDYLKYMVFITNDDDPVMGNEDRVFQAVNQAKPFADAKIKIELVTFKEEFKYGKFFKELLFSCNYKFNYEYLHDMISLEDKLLSLLASRGTRAKFFMSSSDENSFFEVIEKYYVKRISFFNNTKVRREDLKEVVRIKEVDKTGLYSVKFNKNERATFTEEEKDIFVNDSIPMGYTLIGTSSGLIEPGMHSTKPKFIQENRNNPNTLFNTLWKYCYDNKKTLICIRKYRKGTAPLIAELSPFIINNVKSFLVLGVTIFDHLNEQDLGDPDYMQEPTENNGLMETAENFVTTLDFNYNPHQIHNTVTCRKMEYIRAEIMDEPTRPVKDILDLKLVEGAEVDKVVEDFAKFINVSLKRKAKPIQRKAKK